MKSVHESANRVIANKLRQAKARLRWLVFLWIPVLVVTVLQAGVTRVEVKSRSDVLGGRSFGNTGTYEKIVGTVHFAIDPADAHNRVIVDLDKAPINAFGKVEFSSNFFILKPKDPTKATGLCSSKSRIVAEKG